MTCTRTKSKYVRKDAQHECHGGAPPAPAPTPTSAPSPASASVPTPTPAELYLRPVNATGHKIQPAVEPEIAVQLPKQLPGLRRPNSNFPFSILLPPSPSFFLSFLCLSCCLPYTIRFMILLHLRILRCRCRCRCPTDLWTERTLSLPVPCQEWKYGKAAYSKLSNNGRRDREQ